MIDTANVALVAQKEFRDAGRNRWFGLFSLAYALLALGLSWLGLAGLGDYGFAGFGRTTASLINLVLLIVPLMGLLMGALSLAQERERGSLLYLLSQPVSTTEVLAGKFVGLGAAILLALAFGFGVSGLSIALIGGQTDTGVFVGLVGLSALLALASLSLGLLIGSLNRKASAAIGVVVFVWLLLIIFGDLGLMGTAVVLRLRVDSLLMLALVNPLQVFRLAALLNIRDSLEVLGPAGLYATRTWGASLLPGLIGLLVAWVFVPLLIARRVFLRRGAL